MILVASTSAIINSSVTNAYSLISNMERFGEWFPSVIAIRSINKLTHSEVGKKYSERVDVPFMGAREIEITVTQAIENYHFATEGQFLPLLPRMEIYLHQESESTVRIEWAMFSRSSNKFVKILLLPLVKPTMQKRAKAGISTLKMILEDHS